MEAGGSLRRQSCLVADSLRGAPSLLVDPSTGPARGGQNWGNSVIESGEIPLILVTQAFERIARRAGVRIIRLHDVRHTHASLLIAAGVPVKVVSERLGHA